MNAAPQAPRPRDRALVLGGGGSTGNAWLIGVVAGLSRAGLDVTAADLTVGTSAGSTAAAQLAGASPAALLAAILDAAPGRPAAAPARQVTDHLERLRAVVAASADAGDMRRRIGAAALAREAASDGSWQERWRDTVASRLPSPHWPGRALLVTAVDAHTGEPVAFDRDSGVDLVDAVAASCASGLPYRIGGTGYVDGGFRRNENADLAAGYRRVLVLSPFGGATLHPQEWGTSLAAQAAELRAGGSEVETVVPEDSGLFGANAMDPALRPLAARAGRDQGAALAARLRPWWSS